MILLSNVKPKSTTFASILLACATTRAREEGMEIHQRVFDINLSSIIMVMSVLISQNMEEYISSGSCLIIFMLYIEFHGRK